MRVRFLRNIPDNCDIPFVVYQRDEQLAKSPKYINIRGIVEENAKDWLDEVQRSHTQLSKKFLGYTRWWWVMAASRLDVRPWAQEYLFKPLIFARAVLEWMSSNRDIDEILLIGCNHLVAIYLREFRGDLILEGEKRVFLPLSFLYILCKQSLYACAKMFREAIHILRYHTFQKRNFISSKVLILYELFPNISLKEGSRYYYNSLFDSLNNIEENYISYGCVGKSGLKMAELRSGAKEPIFFLLDNINLGDFILCLFINIYLIYCTWLTALYRVPCTIAQHTSVWFWPNYLVYELGRFPCLTEICSYRALRAIFKLHKYKCVIHPYEEKGIERAILFACQEQNIPAIGHNPHPQHHFALALRDRYKPSSPKPSSYAVCGSAYIDFFISWCGKNPDSISVWGTEKSFKEIFKINQMPRNHLSILFLLSHPNELKVFYSWLLAEKRLSRHITYLLRMYKAEAKSFSEVLDSLTRDFDCVQETHGNLVQDLSHCDLAIFCGTSAGIVAVNCGRLAIYLSLNDFFEENACFNELDPMLICRTPAEFCRRLDEINTMDANSLAELYKRQRTFAERIFSPIQSETIEKEILGYTERI